MERKHHVNPDRENAKRDGDVVCTGENKNQDLQQRAIDKAGKLRERLRRMNGRNKMYFGGVAGMWISCLCCSITLWGSGWYVGPTAQRCDQLVATVPKIRVSNPAFRSLQKKRPSLSSQKGMQLRSIKANAWKRAETNCGGILGRTFLIVRSAGLIPWASEYRVGESEWDDPTRNNSVLSGRWEGWAMWKRLLYNIMRFLWKCSQFLALPHEPLSFRNENLYSVVLAKLFSLSSLAYFFSIV